jgi:hypothetical protein
MKKILLLLTIAFGFQHLVWSQQDLNKMTKGLVLGYLNDTLFEGLNERTLILLNQSTKELNVTLFKDGLQVKNSDLQNFFNQLEGDIIVQLTLDPESFEHNENAIEEDIYKTVAFATVNGIKEEVFCSYTVHTIKTNNQTYANMKLSLNIIIETSDFNINTEMGISPELEIEITEGPINVH